MTDSNVDSLFDSPKALEALIYVSDRVREHDMYLTLKTIYMAEKLHLARYGRMIIWDRYHALIYGPVPSRLYDAVKQVRGSHNGFRLDGVEMAIAVTGNRLMRIREPDLDVFSETDLECLDEAIRTYGRHEFGEIKDESHDSAYNKTPRNDAMNLKDIANRQHARTELFRFIEGFYNRTRLHATLHYCSPEQFEQAATAA